MIDRRANHRVDIFSIQKLAIIRERFAPASNEILHFLGAMLRHVANRHLRDVMRSGMLLHLPHVQQSAGLPVGDPNRLDPDKDGIACESNRAPKDLVPVPRR